MCSVDVYGKEHVTMPINEISAGVITMPSTSTKNHFTWFFHTINFLDSWLQCFDNNYHKIIAIHKSNMSKLFETIPKSPPPKKDDYYRENIRQQSGQ